MTPENAKNFKKELRALLAKYDATIGVDIEGDTYCLMTNFVVIDESDGTSEVLSYYNQYIDQSDLK